MSLFALLLTSCGQSSDTNGFPVVVETDGVAQPVANLDADTNRDGVITVDDDAGEETWTESSGLPLLINWDDDDQDGERDSNDGFLNGNQDLTDLAHVIVRQVDNLSTEQVVFVVSPLAAAQRTRVFAETSPGTLELIHGLGDETAILDHGWLATDLNLHVELIDGRSASWDGHVTLSLRISDGASVIAQDAIAARAAPVVFTDNIRPAEAVHVMEITHPGAYPNFPFFDALTTNMPAGVTLASVDEYAYRWDRFLQDSMQMGYQAAINTIVPTHLQIERFTHLTSLFLYLPSELLGPDVGYVYPCSAGGCTISNLSQGGNIEVAPPHAGYPMGRLVIGGGNATTVFGTPSPHIPMAPTQHAWLDAQQVQGPALEVSTEWLGVGHVDEFLAFVPNLNALPGERKWKVVIASPLLALHALMGPYNQGDGDLLVFSGRGEETTIAEIVEDSNFVAFNQLVQARIDSERSILENELGLVADDFIEVPVLYTRYSVWSGYVESAITFNPGGTNLIVVDDVLFVSDPEGPVDNGYDVWKSQIDAALNPLGVNIVYVDAYESYHYLLGGAHCGSNVSAAAYDTHWWELP